MLRGVNGEVEESGSPVLHCATQPIYKDNRRTIFGTTFPVVKLLCIDSGETYVVARLRGVGHGNV